MGVEVNEPSIDTQTDGAKGGTQTDGVNDEIQTDGAMGGTQTDGANDEIQTDGAKGGIQASDSYGEMQTGGTNSDGEREIKHLPFHASKSISADDSAIAEGEEFHELDIELGGVKLNLSSEAADC